MTMKYLATLKARALLLGAFLGSLLLFGRAETAQAQVETPTRAADLGTLWPIDDAEPGKHIPTPRERNQHPLQFGYWLQDMLARAEGARERGEWATMARYYEVLKTALPNQVKPYSRLCSAYYHQGKGEAALPNCMGALSKQGAVVYDHLRFVDLMLRKPALRPDQITAVEASLEHLHSHAKTHPQALPGQELEPQAPQQRADDMTPEERKADPEKWRQLKLQEILRSAAGEPEATTSGDAMHLPTQIEIFRCQLGVRTGDAARLSECTERLTRYRFSPQLLLPFEWAEALAKHDRAEAERLLSVAPKLGLPEAAIDKMQAEQARLVGGGAASEKLAELPRWLMLVTAGMLFLVLAATVFWRRARHSGASPT